MPFPGCKVEEEVAKEASGRIHECSVCGKESTWGLGWEWRYEIHRGDEDTGDPGWEELIKTCSDECRAIDKARSKT